MRRRRPCTPTKPETRQADAFLHSPALAWPSTPESPIFAPSLPSLLHPSSHLPSSFAIVHQPFSAPSTPSTTSPLRPFAHCDPLLIAFLLLSTSFRHSGQTLICSRTSFRVAAPSSRHSFVNTCPLAFFLLSHLKSPPNHALVGHRVGLKDSA